MRPEHSKAQQQLDEAVVILNLTLEHVLCREKSKIRTELRAISFADLGRVASFVRDKCKAYRWVDERSKVVVGSPEKVNLYHLVYNFVGPVTAPVGHEVAPECVQLGPDGEAPGGEAYWMEHQGRRRLRYVRGLPPGPPLGTRDPFVRTFSGSFAELLWNEEREAQWFVSHYWGEPVLDFVTCIAGHDETYKLGGSGLYWICAYANSQTHISEELGAEGPLCSPFFKALGRAAGAVLVMDENSVVTQRMWCGFENVVIARADKCLAIVTAEGGRGHVLTAAPAPVDHGHLNPSGQAVSPEQAQRNRQNTFPPKRLEAATKTHLESAEASNKDDKAMIIEVVKNELGGFQRADSNLRVLGATALFALDKVTPECVQALNEAAEPFALHGYSDTMEAAMEMGLVLLHCGGVTLGCQEFGDMGVQAFGEALGRAQHLTTANLNFEGCEQVGDAGVTALGGGLGRASDLNSVSLNFAICQQVGDIGVKALAEGLGRAPKLSAVTLNFEGCRQVGDSGVQALGESLSQAPSLISVNLNFEICEQVGDAGLQALGEGFSRTLNLSEVNLNFEGCSKVGDAGMQGLGDGLGRTPNLSSVILNCEICRQIGDAGVKALAAGLSRAAKLELVDLNFEGCRQIGDSGVQALGDGLGRTANLASVKLDFGGCNKVGDSGMRALGEGLGQAANLNLVDLYFSRCEQVKDAGVQALGAGLSRIPSLSALTLNFEGCREVGDTGLQALGEILGMSPHVTAVTLNFLGCGKVGHAGLQALGEGLSRVPHLSVVELEFPLCEQIGDACMRALGDGLGRAQKLSSVTLNFLGCEQIGDVGVQALGEALSQAPHLSSVTLNFSHCRKVGNVGVQALGEALGQASKLSSVNLNFRYCNSIGDAGAQALGLGLSQARNLTSVQLGFFDTRVKVSNRSVRTSKTEEVSRVLDSLAAGSRKSGLQRVGLCAPVCRRRLPVAPG
mmetsp:Transcript_123509/g.283190  ORF Transcript_123509/g.283190 Transcript_123509/m.283190 type:complete len:961 (+) Transcript_123509:27-2909(+)